jgi:hypothetical protein
MQGVIHFDGVTGMQKEGTQHARYEHLGSTALRGWTEELLLNKRSKKTGCSSVAAAAARQSLSEFEKQ